MKIIQFLDDYLSLDNLNFSLFIDLPKIKQFNDRFTDISIKYDRQISTYSNNFDFNSNFGNLVNSKKVSDVYENAFIGSTIFLHNFYRSPIVEAYIKESTIRFLENIEDYLLLIPYFDETCYYYLNEIFNNALNLDTSNLKTVIHMHEIYSEHTLPIDKKMVNLNVVASIESYLEYQWKNLTIQEAFAPENLNFIEKIKASNKEKQREYLENWLLNHAHIIEEKFKTCLATCCKVQTLAKNQSISRYINLPKSRIKLASVLWHIDKNYVKYKNVERIRHIRNAIDHANIKYHIQGNWDQYFFKFTDLDFSMTQKIDGFILDYFKIVKFIFTFELICSFYSLRVENQGRQVGEILSKWFEENFPTLIKEIQESPELKREDLKGS